MINPRDFFECDINKKINLNVLLIDMFGQILKSAYL